eukprot:TRINITY_DN14721_c0_g1_i1.p1 TRINITY_DN14721_c0_g1~~TRINITY_DN14721_c0_g1_i1.p1  ORF type:complete len:113 (+),score=23.29 TRINITY_DN14721_c0_g1_i1:43-339(+)
MGKSDRRKEKKLAMWLIEKEKEAKAKKEAKFARKKELDEVAVEKYRKEQSENASMATGFDILKPKRGISKKRSKRQMLSKIAKRAEAMETESTETWQT